MADLVPTMTSNTAPSGTCYAWSGTTAWMAFDDSDASYFTANAGGTKWLRYDFTAGTAPIIESYTVRANSAVAYPTGWLFQGSNDFTNWTTLDTRAGLTWSGLETKSFAFGNTTAYNQYRLYTITAATTQLYIYEVTMWTGPHTPILPLSVTSAVAIGQPYVVVGALPPDGVTALSMPTFRPEMLSVGVGPLSGVTPALANPTLDITDLVEGLAWDKTTRGGLGGLSFYMRQPTGSRSTKTSTNLCPDPLGTDIVWWKNG